MAPSSTQRNIQHPLPPQPPFFISPTPNPQTIFGQSLRITSELINFTKFNTPDLALNGFQRFTYTQKYWISPSHPLFVISTIENVMCIVIFLKRFICLVEVHYHKVNLNSDNQILHVKFSSPTRWLLQDWFVMTQYCSRWITARWWLYCANFCSLCSPSPSRCVRLPQGGCRINGIDGISLHLCSSLVICGCISLLLCLELDLPFLFLLSSHSPSLWHGFPLQHGPWGLSPTFHFATVFSCLLCTQLIHWLSLFQIGAP